jgi:branched-chain amino acid transport system permease protein
MLPQFIANGIVSGCIFALVALGFGLIYHSTQVFHVAHGAVYTASAYVFYSLLISLHFHLVLSLIGAVIFSVLLGLILERYIYYPLYKRGASMGVVFISSLGVYTFVVNFIAMLYGNETKVLSSSAEKTFHVGTVILTRIQLVEVAAFLLLSALTLGFLRLTRWGRLIQALADNPQLVSVIGMDGRKIRWLIFALGSALAGFAACLVVLDVGMDPHVGMNILLIAAVAVIIGGVHVFEGGLVGAFLLGLLQNMVIWQLSAKWEQAVTFVLLIVFLLTRPEGILSGQRRLEEA